MIETHPLLEWVCSFVGRLDGFQPYLKEGNKLFSLCSLMGICFPLGLH